MKVFDQSELTKLNQTAAASPRRRGNLNWHADYTAAVQRLFISMQPDSYVRPHKHVEANKWECFVVLQGTLLFVTYKADGTILNKISLGPEQPASVVEIPSGVWHSTVALEANTTFFEIKEGPYTPINDKGFATWAPEEGTPQAQEYINWLINAKVGDFWSAG